MITLTMACSIVGFALTVVQANNGAGRHRGDVPADIYQYGMFINFINQPIYLFAICFAKLAVGAALMRIAADRFYKYLIGGIMGFMLFYTTACFFVSLVSSLILYEQHRLTSYRPSCSSAPMSGSCGTHPSKPHAGNRPRSEHYHSPTQRSESPPTCSSPL